MGDQEVRDHVYRDKKSRFSEPIADRDRSPVSAKYKVFVNNIPIKTFWKELKDFIRDKVGEVTFAQIFRNAGKKTVDCGIIVFPEASLVEKALSLKELFKGHKLTISNDSGICRDAYGNTVKVGDKNTEKHFSKKLIKVPKYMEPPKNGPRNMEPFKSPLPNDFNTYGLSKQFLSDLGIQPPLLPGIFVGNLDFRVDKKKLKEVFRMAGRVISVELLKNKEGASKGFATIEYDHPVEAVQAISMFNNQFLYERKLKIKINRGDPKMRGLPEGLQMIGPGLGRNGEPMRDVVRNLPNKQVESNYPQDYFSNADINDRYPHDDSRYSQNPTANTEMNSSYMQNNMPDVGHNSNMDLGHNNNRGISNNNNMHTDMMSNDRSGMMGIQNVGNAPAVPPMNVLSGQLNLQALGLLQSQLLQQQLAGGDFSNLGNIANIGLGLGGNMGSGDIVNQLAAAANPLATAAQLALLGNIGAVGGNMGLRGANINAFNRSSGASNRSGDQAPFSKPTIEPVSNRSSDQGGFNRTGDHAAYHRPTDEADFNRSMADADFNRSVGAYHRSSDHPGFDTPGEHSDYNKLTSEEGYSRSGDQAAFNRSTAEPDFRSEDRAGFSRHSSDRGFTRSAKERSMSPSYHKSSRNRHYNDHDLPNAPPASTFDRSDESSHMRKDMVVISNLPPSISWNIIREKLSDCGEVKFAEMTGKDSAVVSFERDWDAHRAIDMFDGTRIDGRVISVRYY